jgi:hypothetical protein
MFQSMAFLMIFCGLIPVKQPRTGRITSEESAIVCECSMDYLCLTVNLNLWFMIIGFGKEIVRQFLAKHDFDLVARAHMVVESGG